MIKAVILDLDGTLADTMGDLMTAMNSMLREMGYPERTREDLLGFINKGARRFVGQSLPERIVKDTVDYSDSIVTEAVEIYSKYYAKCYADKTCAYDGMREELIKMKERGIKLGVLSNKQDKFVKVIVEKLFPGLFDSVHGQLNLPEKPDPAPALAVAGELGALPHECVFVGDSDVDVKTAINSKMHGIGVTWGYRSGECLRQAGSKLIIDDVHKLADAVFSI